MIFVTSDTHFFHDREFVWKKLIRLGMKNVVNKERFTWKKEHA